MRNGEYRRGKHRGELNYNENVRLYVCILFMQDADCIFGYDRESVACSDNVCKCANGYYHRSGNICRRKSMSESNCFLNKRRSINFFGFFFRNWRCLCRAYGL